MNIPERPPGEDLHGASWILVFVSWWIASLATLGALFLSGCMQYVLCVPCWYQRIFMFPLVPILLVGLFTFDRRVVRYALPLGVIGWLIAVSHLLLIAGVVPEEIKPHTQGIPCSEMQIMWFGFATIPLLSVALFSIINALLVVAHLKSSKNESENSAANPSLQTGRRPGRPLIGVDRDDLSRFQIERQQVNLGTSMPGGKGRGRREVPLKS